MSEPSPFEVMEALENYEKNKNMKLSLPLSKLELNSILNKEEVTDVEMLAVVSSYILDSGLATEIYSIKELKKYFEFSEKRYANNFCIAKKWYFKWSEVENLTPLEKIAKEDLVEGEYYWDKFGNMFIYHDEKFKEVALERRDYKEKKFFITKFPEEFENEPKLTLIKNRTFVEGGGWGVD